MRPNKLLASVVIAAVFAAIAGPVNAAESWYKDQVKTIYPLSNGDFAVTFVTSPAACLNGATDKYFHVQVGQFGVTSDGVRALLATALTAYVAGKKLSVVFDDTSVSCSVNRMVISE